MEFDIIFAVGGPFFDHPLNGVAILKRLLEREGYTVGIIENPENEEDIRKLGKPRLFFGVSSGGIDSMLVNYTPLKKRRDEDEHSDVPYSLPDRAAIVYSNWIRKNFKDSKIILGGVEASLRRFSHYDYWDNKVRHSVLLDSRADILAYGSSEKQIVEIANRLSENKDLIGISGTCIVSKEVQEKFIIMPSHEDITNSKEAFCDMQNSLSNNHNLAQKDGSRYILQYKAPIYTSVDLDDYYGLPFSRNVPKELRGFQFSIVTHRGCIGNCNFCSLTLLQGDRIISRSEESIIKEAQEITKNPFFKGNIDDLGGPSANMYGMDCNKCFGSCIDCNTLDRSNSRLINLLRSLRNIKGINNIYIKSGIRFDLAADEYLKELSDHHIFDTLRIAPEHVDSKVLKLMNKDKGDLDGFIKRFKKINPRKELSFYFMTAHPGSTMDEAKILADKIRTLKNAESVQVFTPTPMSVSTCMYYTGLDPKTKEKIHVPYTYKEKKEQKRIIFSKDETAPADRSMDHF